MRKGRSAFGTWRNKKSAADLKTFYTSEYFSFLTQFEATFYFWKQKRQIKPPKQCFCLRARQVKRSYCTDQSLQAINQTFFSFWLNRAIHLSIRLHQSESCVTTNNQSDMAAISILFSENIIKCGAFLQVTLKFLIIKCPWTHHRWHLSEESLLVNMWLLPVYLTHKVLRLINYSFDVHTEFSTSKLPGRERLQNCVVWRVATVNAPKHAYPFCNHIRLKTRLFNQNSNAVRLCPAGKQNV